MIEILKTLGTVLMGVAAGFLTFIIICEIIPIVIWLVGVKQ